MRRILWAASRWCVVAIVGCASSNSGTTVTPDSVEAVEEPSQVTPAGEAEDPSAEAGQAAPGPPVVSAHECGPWTIYFDFDLSNIRADMRPILDEVVTCMRFRPEATLRLECHTSMQGSAEYNFAISGRQAGSVIRYLAGHDVTHARIDRYDQGEAQPVCTDPSESCQARNRRCELALQ